MDGDKILIVEDEGLVALDLRRRLEALGYRIVAQAATGEDAVRKAAETNPDLILMDIRLGKGMDGIDAAAEIRKRQAVPIIYLTANSDRATLDRAKVTGPHGYILKPFRDRELQISMEMALYRHRAEKALRDSREWFAAMLACVEEAVIANDKDGAVQYMNAAAERLTGWREQEAKGRPLAEVVGTVQGGASRGMRDLEDRLMRLRLPGKDMEGEVVAFRDVTEMRRLERQLAQKQKMEAIGRLAGGIAHDFNNLLTAIIGFANMLKEKLPSQDPLASDVQMILESGERAAALTRQLLTFSRQQSLALTEQDLGALARNMGKLLRRVIGEDVDILITSDEGLWKVNADAGQMEQVIMNLAVNARAAMPRGGRITIEARNVRLDAGELGPREEVESGDYVMLAVSDTGTGMDPEIMSHIFEPFFTTKAPGEGTGMGLATVHGIIRQSRGHVTVYSEPGHGTSFKIYFPRARALGRETPPPVAEAAKSLQGGRETLLLVDDEPSIRALMRETLIAKGYRILDAGTPEEALGTFAGHPGEISLLITDVVMPGMDGSVLADRIRTLDPSIPVLFISGYADRTIVHGGLLKEGINFLGKPFSPSDLVRKVRDVLDRLVPAVPPANLEGPPADQSL